MLTYYRNLHAKNGIREIAEREQRIRDSQASMCEYYCELNLIEKCDIYCSMLNDYYRSIITRWRLSNHRLRIEIGRYTNPYTERENRTCTLCNQVEDEHHAIFACPRNIDLRVKYDHILKDVNIQKFLNPSYNRMMETARFLHDVDKRY